MELEEAMSQRILTEQVLPAYVRTSAVKVKMKSAKANDRRQGQRRTLALVRENSCPQRLHQ